MIEFQVRIIAFSKEALADLTQTYKLKIVYRSAKEINKDKYSIEGFMSHEQMDQLEKVGYQIEILKDLRKRPDPRNQVSKINRYHEKLNQLRKKGEK